MAEEGGRSALIACHVCGKAVRRRGLHHHLTLAHKVSSEEASRIAALSRVADVATEWVEQLLELEAKVARLEERIAGEESEEVCTVLRFALDPLRLRLEEHLANVPYR